MHNRDLCIEDKRIMLYNDPRKLLLWFAQERDLVRAAKNTDQPKPWTKDVFLQRYWTLNSFKRYDDQSVMYQNWIDVEAPLPTILFNSLVWRLLNRKECLTGIPFVYDFSKGSEAQKYLLKYLQDRKDRGLVIFSAAFQMSNLRSGKEKHIVLFHTLQNVWERIDNILEQLHTYPDIKSMVGILSGTVPMLGPTMAYEIIEDLVAHGLIEEPENFQTWAYIGRGAIDGLNYIMNRKKGTRISADVGQRELASLRNYIKAHWEIQATPCGLVDVLHMLWAFGAFAKDVKGMTHKSKRRYYGSAPTTVDRTLLGG